jgi:anthranilate phosphoribosyltransferase
MLTSLLNNLIARRDLTQAEAASLLDLILTDDVTDARIAGTLIALAAKGETEEELAGFAETMRVRCARITTRHLSFIDTCGTGGSAAKTFNVSTAAAFVVAAAGVPVAKHGNVGVTSQAGSADVLRVLDVNTNLAPDHVSEIFDEIGICFMFAPLHHAATKRVAQVRRDLGVRTIFNLLGPLTNPAGAPFQVVGVSNESACQKVAGALSRLGTKRAWIVRGEDGLDEITLAGKTTVFESSADGVRRFEIAPEDFGLTRTSLDDLRGGSAEENAQTICAVLSGVRQDAARDLVLLNAAASIYIAGGAANFAEAMAAARMVINNGTAMAKLRALQSLSHRSCGSI